MSLFGKNSLADLFILLFALAVVFMSVYCVVLLLDDYQKRSDGTQSLANNYQSLEKAYDELQKERDQLLERISGLEKELEKYKNPVKTSSGLDEASKRLENANKQLGEIVEGVRKLRKERDYYRNKTLELEQKLKKYEADPKPSDEIENIIPKKEDL